MTKVHQERAVQFNTCSHLLTEVTPAPTRIKCNLYTNNCNKYTNNCNLYTNICNKYSNNSSLYTNIRY